MSEFLHVCAGPYQLLLEVEGIHEIIEIGADSAAAAGHRDWRGRALTAINARALLGLEDAALPAPHAGVVYSVANDAAPVLLELDRVACLRRAESTDLLPLPGVPEPTRRLFDGVLRDGRTGIQIYHLRRPLATDALSGDAGNDASAEIPNDGDARAGAATTQSATAAPDSQPRAKRRRDSRKRR